MSFGFFLKHLWNKDGIIRQMHLLPHSPLQTLWERLTKSPLCLYMETQPNACRRWLFPGQPIERRWQIWPVFFICCRYKIKFCKWVQNPSHQLRLSKTYPIKLCNARVNVLLHLNNQIMDWRPIGQRLFFLWENVLCPGISLKALFHKAMVPHYRQTRLSAPFRPEHSPLLSVSLDWLRPAGNPALVSYFLIHLIAVVSSMWAMLNPLSTVRKEETNFREVKIWQSSCTQE